MREFDMGLSICFETNLPILKPIVFCFEDNDARAFQRNGVSNEFNTKVVGFVIVRVPFEPSECQTHRNGLSIGAGILDDGKVTTIPPYTSIIAAFRAVSEN